ncbi:unnamed protein product [Plutella xylostella]|uniref:(diamondback moth) hypothetical protein n=1 Tax=Plutella xylostella TaxID=51655 RepID=A0A8S4GI97_PLUXY|nr:unnamed protein product [Plutella xylostella]
MRDDDNRPDGMSLVPWKRGQLLMVRHYKRKTVTKYCKEHLLKALEDIRNKKLNYCQAAKVYGIPTSTLVSRIRRRLKKSLNEEEQAEVSASSALVPLGSKPGSKKREPPEIKTYKNNYFLKKYVVRVL